MCVVYIDLFSYSFSVLDTMIMLLSSVGTMNLLNWFSRISIRFNIIIMTTASSYISYLLQAYNPNLLTIPSTSSPSTASTRSLATRSTATSTSSSPSNKSNHPSTSSLASSASATMATSSLDTFALPFFVFPRSTFLVAGVSVNVPGRRLIACRGCAAPAATSFLRAAASAVMYSSASSLALAYAGRTL